MAAGGDLTTIISPEARYLVNMGKSFGETALKGSDVPTGIHDIASAGGNAGYYWQLNDGVTTDGTHPNTFGGSSLRSIGDYVGYGFKQPVAIHQVIFRNKVYSDGGTFADPPTLAARVGYGGGTWIEVYWGDWSPTYQSGFVSGVHSYTADLTGLAPIDGIRLQGTAAGSADGDGFIGVAELQVFGEMLPPNPVAVGSDLTGRVAMGVNVLGSQYDPANLIDDDLTTYDTSFFAEAGWDWYDLVTVCFDEPQPDITAVGLVFKFLHDGGWYDESLHPIQIYYAGIAGGYSPVSGLDKSTYSDEYEALAALPHAVESGYLFTFEPIPEPVLCISIEGDGGGTANPDPGDDTEGFVAITELEIFQIPEIFDDGFESGITSAWSTAVP